MKPVTIYGIPNCDSTKKAVNWLKANNIPFTFHDYKKEGISLAKLNEWTKLSSWEILLNKKGTTWKKIDPAIQATITNSKLATSLMKEHTSLIKRPILEVAGKILVGFSETTYHENLM